MCPKTELFAVKVATHFGSFCFARFMKKVLGAFSRFMCPKMTLYAATFRRISEVLSVQALWRKLWVHFHDFCVQKRSCFLWSWDAFWTFSPCKLYKTFLGAFSRFLCPQTKLFAVKFSRILEVLRLQGLRKKFCTNFHDLCAAKRRCLLWSSHTFCKFSACKVYRKSYGRIITIYASKNEVVCCEVQTHFGSSPPARFSEKNSGSFFTIYVSITNKHSWLQHFLKNFGHVLQFYAPINLCCVVQTHCDVLDFHIL